MRLKLIFTARMAINIVIGAVVLFPPIVRSQTCGDLFAVTSPDVRLSCDVACASPVVLAHAVSDSLIKRIGENAFGKRTRGYVLITAAMVTSAAVSTHLTAELPKDMTFLSHLVGQVSTIGIFVLGAPIWEPISSAFRKFAFGLGVEKELTPTSDPALEKLWQRTQGQYSLNAQMSRNVLHSFLLAAQANFGSARVAIEAGRSELAVDLLAETAIRLRRLFAEIDPQDASVTLAIQSSFTRHVEHPSHLRSAILRRIEESDSDSTSPQTRLYYETLLRAWLQ